MIPMVPRSTTICSYTKPDQLTTLDVFYSLLLVFVPPILINMYVIKKEGFNDCGRRIAEDCNYNGSIELAAAMSSWWYHFLRGHYYFLKDCKKV